MEKTLDTIAVVQFCGLIIESLGIIILRETKQWLQLPLTCLVTVDLETICRYLIIYDEYIYIYMYVYIYMYSIQIVCVSTSRSGWNLHSYDQICQYSRLQSVFLNINHWLDKCASTVGCFNTSIQHFLVQTYMPKMHQHGQHGPILVISVQVLCRIFIRWFSCTNVGNVGRFPVAEHGI